MTEYSFFCVYFIQLDYLGQLAWHNGIQDGLLNRLIC